MNNVLAALIISLAILGQPWSSWFFGYSELEHDAAKMLCEERFGQRMAENLTVSERISTLVLATCKEIKTNG